MKKILLFLLISISVFAQKKEVIIRDTTGNVFVLFVRDDSVAVVYQGKQSVFTSDGIYAYDFSAWNMKLKGFMRYNGLKQSIEDAKNDICKQETDTTIIDPIDPPTDEKTVMFPNPINYGNARYIIEPSDWDKVSVNKDLVYNMQGFDFAPIEANQGNNIYEYKEWNQGYFSIKGRDVWQDRDKIYFIKPKGYNTDTKNNLMDFDVRFPNFTLPKNKIVVMQPTPKREIGVYNYLKKGVSFVKGRNDDKGYVFVSDGWLIDLGCPYAYDDRPNAKEIFDKWCEDVDGDKLLQSFIENVYYPNRYKGYVMLNWEHVGHRWQVRQDKIIRCLEYWATHEHTAKMALWTVSGIGIGRPKFQGLGIDFTPMLTFQGSIEAFQRTYKEYVSVDFSYAKYVEVGHIGGYMNYPIDYGIIHHYLTELLLHRKFNKGKKLLWTFWFDQELINNFNLERVKVESTEGTYFAQVKPKVFPSVAFNVGVWSILGDGLDCWSDPNYWTDDKRYWGWGAKDVNGNDLPTKHDEVGAKYPSQPMKAVDWMMQGIWAMSVNKDIIEANGEWEFVTLPTKSFYDKSVMIAYKIRGDESLVLALDGFGKIDGEKTHEFVINGKKYDIKTFGRFTSVVRLKL